MNHLKVIKSDQEHQQALARLSALMDADPAEGSAEGDELEVLALLIEQYEKVRYPVDRPDPIEAIKFRMDQQSLRQKDLVPYIGSVSKVSEVLNGVRPLSLNMIRKLSAGLGIPADVLIGEQEPTASGDHDIEWQQFPLAEMRKRGYFGDFAGNLRELKDYGEEQISRFLSSVNNGFALCPAMLRTSTHVRSGNKKTDSHALWAWQVRVLQKAGNELLPVAYHKGTVSLDWMRKLAQLSWSERGPVLAKEYLNKHGIHLIFEDHLPKTYLDGAVCLGASGNPVVALTLRHDRLDNFWFTLLHELAHVALHLDALHIDGTDGWFIDDLEVQDGNKLEQEADQCAQKALLPVAAKELQTLQDAEGVRNLARKLSIHPGIIAGRLRHERSDHRFLGAYFRDKVRPLLELS